MSDTTLYYRTGTGAAGRMVTTLPEAEAELPDDAVRITAGEYEQARAALDAAHAGTVGELVAREDEQRREDYEALVALRVPEGTARRLTGYVDGA